MKKARIVMLMTAIFALLGVFFSSSHAAEEGKDAKTVAWYTANIKEAQARNKQCHDDPSIKNTTDCLSALHALEISFGVGHK